VERQPRRPPSRVGHRRHAERHAADAREAVEQAQAAIAAIQADGAQAKANLDDLQRQTTTLRTHAEPIEALDTFDRAQIRQLDQVIDAAGTYIGWLEGRPTPTARLTHAVDTLAAVARCAPSFARHAAEIDQTQWYEFLELAPPLHELDQERTAPGLQHER
jgi:hypothetical protein